MLKWLIRFGAGVAVTAAVAWIAREALKLWVDGPDVEPSRDPWPQVASGPARTAPTRAATRAGVAVATPPTPTRTPPAPTPPPGSPKTGPTPPATATPPATVTPATPPTGSSKAQPAARRSGSSPHPLGQAPPPGATWVLPDAHGAVPDRHPVKANLRSGLYHLPGMVAYERTHPDRCYPTAEAAEADGFKKAKR